ncbi:DinB family protein [Roseimaritima sediminicola]|uniref:DinB family protein n=1 Tax=Roseimaritima sediminicola TaxID=2662066 RepID=UPI00129857BF|nr:DinB family protein [Roseimaritima sediminicola]
MDAHDVIAQAAKTSRMILESYVSDLEDAELLRRPGPGCNHIAWQLGHLIVAECGLLDSVRPGSAITLPEGFAETHSKENADSDKAEEFCSKQQYLELLSQTAAATQTALRSVSAEDLDAPAPEHLRQMFPRVGDVFLLIASHPLMHVGQWVPVRRALNKPVLI